MVSTSLMVDTSSHPRVQLHRCVERSAYGHCGRAPCRGRITNSTLPDTPQWPPQPRPARSMLRVMMRSA